MNTPEQLRKLVDESRDISGGVKCKWDDALMWFFEDHADHFVALWEAANVVNRYIEQMPFTWARNLNKALAALKQEDGK